MGEARTLRKLGHAFIGRSRVRDEVGSAMPLPALILPILAAAATAPITVTGHAWAPFISPMGEPFRARTAADDTLARWFAQADRNHDGMLTADEMRGDAERFFATLDMDHNGEIDPDELARYEWEVAPDVQVMSRTRRMPGEAAGASQEDRPGDGPHRRARRHEDSMEPGGLQGAARYGLLNMPEPVAAADTDFNRGVSLAEFREAATLRFQLLDDKRTGRLVLPDLEALRAARLADRRSRPRERAPDRRIGNPLPSGD